jgi:hypothetical protein
MQTARTRTTIPLYNLNYIVAIVRNCESFWHPDLGLLKHHETISPLLTKDSVTTRAQGWHDRWQPSNSVQNHSGRERSLPKRSSISRVSGRFIWRRSYNFPFALRKQVWSTGVPHAIININSGVHWLKYGSSMPVTLVESNMLFWKIRYRYIFPSKTIDR